MRMVPGDRAGGQRGVLGEPRQVRRAGGPPQLGEQLPVPRGGRGAVPQIHRCTLLVYCHPIHARVRGRGPNHGRRAHLRCRRHGHRREHVQLHDRERVQHHPGHEREEPAVLSDH